MCYRLTPSVARDEIGGTMEICECSAADAVWDANWYHDRGRSRSRGAGHFWLSSVSRSLHFRGSSYPLRVARELPCGGSMFKVVIVDDEQRFADTLALFLESFVPDLEVVVAVTGEEGLDRLADHRDTRVLVTDLHLPGIDGLEVVRRAAELYPGLRILMMSGFGNEAARCAAAAAGVECFLDKPLDLEELVTFILKSGEAVGRRDRGQDEKR